MRRAVHRLSGLGLVGCVGLFSQDRFLSGVEIKHDWALLVVALGFFLAFVMSTDRFGSWVGDRRNRPQIVTTGVADYWRTARDSPKEPALQVVYARVRNNRDGGGDRATAHGVRAWMEAIDMLGKSIASVRGIWVKLDARVPDPRTNSESVDLLPTRYEVGLELAAKFIWSDYAYLAGEGDPPSLKPGKYLIRASVGDGTHKARILEWHVEHGGEGTPLVMAGITHPTHAVVTTREARDSWSAWDVEAVSASELSAGHLTVTSAIYGVPGREADVRARLNSLIVDDVLDFIVDNETLGVDPAKGEDKVLRIRWGYRGKPDASSYLEYTHVVIPREATREPDAPSGGASVGAGPSTTEREVDALIRSVQAARANVVLRGRRGGLTGLGAITSDDLVIVEAREYIGRHGTPAEGEHLRDLEGAHRRLRTPEARVARLDALLTVLAQMKTQGAP